MSNHYFPLPHARAKIERYGKQYRQENDGENAVRAYQCDLNHVAVQIRTDKSSYATAWLTDEEAKKFALAILLECRMSLSDMDEVEETLKAQFP